MKNLRKLTFEEELEFEAYKYLIPYIANVSTSEEYLKVHMLDMSDIEHYALIGLIKGIQTFDPNNTAQKKTYYIQSIKWEIGKGIRKDSLRLPSQSAEEAIHITSLDIQTGENGDDTIMDIIIDDNETISVSWSGLEDADERLPLVLSKLLAGYTRIDIEREQGWGRHTVKRLVEKHKPLILESIEY